jgi:hypothetical protein
MLDLCRSGGMVLKALLQHRVGVQALILRFEKMAALGA